MRAAQWTLRVEDDREMDRLARAAAEQEFDQSLPYLDGVRQIVFEYFEDIIGFRPLEGLVLNDGAYLGDRFVISYSPSADIFVSSHQGAVRPLSPSVFAMGDALFNENQGGPVAISGSIDQTQHRSVVGMLQHRAATNGDPGALAALPRLPFAGVELNRIAALYPSAVVLREHDATEANIRKYLAGSPAQQVDIIHMATHALSETPLRQRCALALSRRGVDASPGNDGLVDGLEIQLGWNLDADLVCLSGCQTASGPGWFRGEPMGLSTILLGVGARSVIASVWKVDDLATARLMERFYENLSGKYADVRAGRVATAMSKAQALAEAKRWLRLYTTPEGRKPFAHPVYWSGFILIGDPG
jgi:CHAT domain-containing protein